MFVCVYIYICVSEYTERLPGQDRLIKTVTQNPVQLGYAGFANCSCDCESWSWESLEPHSRHTHARTHAHTHAHTSSSSDYVACGWESLEPEGHAERDADALQTAPRGEAEMSGRTGG
jgi:hypothetical protein